MTTIKIRVIQLTDFFACWDSQRLKLGDCIIVVNCSQAVLLQCKCFGNGTSLLLLPMSGSYLHITGHPISTTQLYVIDYEPQTNIRPHYLYCRFLLRLRRHDHAYVMSSASCSASVLATLPPASSNVWVPLLTGPAELSRFISSQIIITIVNQTKPKQEYHSLANLAIQRLG